MNDLKTVRTPSLFTFAAVIAGIALLSGDSHAVGPALLDAGGGSATISILIEAESVPDPAPFEPGADPQPLAAASGGGYLHTADESGDQQSPPAEGADYEFTLVAGGDLALWARVWTPDVNSDSFWFQIDDGAWASWEPGVHLGWTWQRIAVVQAPAGSHVLSFAPQEDGGRLDAFLLTSDLNLVPSNGLEFSGDRALRSHVEIPGFEFLAFNNVLTLEAWVNLADTPSGEWDPIVSRGNEWALLRYQATNKVAFRTGPEDLVSGTELEPDRWYHVACVFDAGEKRIYIDGVLDRRIPGGAALTPGPAQLRFGVNQSAPSTVYRGKLDEVRLWSTARSAAEIAAGWDRSVTASEAGLEGLWRMDGTGNTVTNAGPHGSDGILAGFAKPVRGDGVRLTGPSTALRSTKVSVPETEKSRFDFADSGFTVESWVRFDEAPAARVPLVTKGLSGAWGLFLDPSGKVSFDTAGLAGADGETLRSDSALVADEWAHLAITWEPSPDGLGGLKTIFLNGGFESSEEVEGVLGQSDLTVTAGGVSGPVLDEIRVWGRALPAERIAAQSRRNLNGLEPGLLFLWRFDFPEDLARNSELSATSGGLDGSLEGGLSTASFVPGVPLGEALPPQFNLAFDGINEAIRIEHDQTLNFDPQLTIEVWVNPEAQQPGTIILKGTGGYGLGLDDNLTPVFFGGPDLSQALRANATLVAGEWFHLAVVVDTTDGPNGATTFYINGQPAGRHSVGVIANNNGRLWIGRGHQAIPEDFAGQIDEVRLWASALSPGQISVLAQIPLGQDSAGFPELSAYWSFDEGMGSRTYNVNGAGNPLEGTLVNMDESNWRFGHDFGVPQIQSGLDLTLSDASVGLWIGQVVLTQVSEAQGANLGEPGPPRPTSDSAAFRILLHVGEDGGVRLLKDVIVMQKRDDPDDENSTTSIVLVTDPSKIPDFTGVVRRGGKLAGLRYGTAAYDFDGLEMSMAGGLGAGLSSLGKIVLRPAHPTNPFLHRFHPRHGADGSSLVTRNLTITFSDDGPDPLVTNVISGSYRETVTGLHKIPITTTGVLNLTRISEEGVLNE